MIDLTREELCRESLSSLRDRLGKYKGLAMIARGTLDRLGSRDRLALREDGQYNTQAFWPQLRGQTVGALSERLARYEAFVTMVEEILRERGDER